MKKVLRFISCLLLLIGWLPVRDGSCQIVLSSGVIADGGASLTGSHRLVATVGQAMAGSAGSTLTAGFWGGSSSGISVAVEGNGVLPQDFSLDQNYPNPFNPTTVISYHLSAARHVQLRIYDVFGRQVATLVEGNKPGGTHTVHFNADLLASGVYLYRLLLANVNEASGGRVIVTRTMVLLH